MPSIHNNAEKSPFQKLFELFGVSFASNGKEVRAEECPFCGKDKFHLNTETGQYKCHSANTCGAVGNAYLCRQSKSEMIRLSAARAVLELGTKLRETVELEERIAALEGVREQRRTA